MLHSLLTLRLTRSQLLLNLIKFLLLRKSTRSSHAPQKTLNPNSQLRNALCISCNSAKQANNVLRPQTQSLAPRTNASTQPKLPSLLAPYPTLLRLPTDSRTPSRRWADLSANQPVSTSSPPSPTRSWTT